MKTKRQDPRKTRFTDKNRSLLDEYLSTDSTLQPVEVPDEIAEVLVRR
jgi:hypothetical protein